MYVSATVAMNKGLLCGSIADNIHSLRCSAVCIQIVLLWQFSKAACGLYVLP